MLKGNPPTICKNEMKGCKMLFKGYNLFAGHEPETLGLKDLLDRPHSYTQVDPLYTFFVTFITKILCGNFTLTRAQKEAESLA